MQRTPGQRSAAALVRPGFSLLEVLVALVVMGTVAGMLTPLVMTARRMVQSDQLRTTTNQGVRAGSDIIGSDIRMAGERFPRGSALTLPPIEIVVGGAGVPDELILRRNLWEATLPVCDETLDDSHATILVVRLAADPFWTGPNGPTHAECSQPLDGLGWPTNLADVKELADSITTNGVLRGYLFDPAAAQGEFIDFEVQSNANSTGAISRMGTVTLQYSYVIDNRPLIYILEERHYRVRNGILELVLNGQTGTPLRVAAGISDLVARYVMSDGTVAATLPAGTTWRDIGSVELTLTSVNSVGPDSVTRSLTTRYFPRNVLSR